MKRQRKLSLLDPNVPVVRNVSKTFLNSDGQENHSRKRKQPECDEAVAKKILVTSAQTDCSPAPHVRANVIDTLLSKPNDFEDIVNSELILGARLKLSKSFCNNPLFAVTPYHREVAIEWLIDIQGYLKIGNDALHLAVALMDVVFDKVKISEDEIQAVAAAAMWLAYKFLYGGIKANKILKYCGTVSRDQLLRNERIILKATEMNLMFTNPMTILHSQLFGIFGEQLPLVEYHMSNYLLEIMLLVADFAKDSIAKRTTVAVVTTLKLLQSRPDIELENIKGATPGGLIIHKRLLSTLRTIWNTPSFREKSSLFHKYSSHSKQAVSLHPGLDPDLFES